MVHTIPGAMLCVDAVAYAPHRQIDVKDLGVDFYAFSWYKASQVPFILQQTNSNPLISTTSPSPITDAPPQVYGPHISMLYASLSAQESSMASLGHYFNPSSTLEGKLGLAASNYELTAAIPCVSAYFGSSPSASVKTWSAIKAHEAALQEILLSYLRRRKDVTIFGELSPNPELRVPTVSFVIDGQGSRSVVERVESVSAFGFRWGAFYSNRLVENVLGLGKEGVVRVSMVHYNTGMLCREVQQQRQ